MRTRGPLALLDVRGSRRAGLFLLPAGFRLRLRLREAGCEYGDLRFPGDGGLGRGGMPEFRAMNRIDSIKPGASVLAEAEIDGGVVRPALVGSAVSTSDV